MTFRYNGINKKGKTETGTITAEKEIDAILKIREMDRIVLILSLKQQSSNKLIQKITNFKNEQSLAIKNLISTPQVNKGSLSKKRGSFLDRIQNKKVTKPRKSKFKFLNKKEMKIEKKEIEEYKELISIFNSESFEEIKEISMGKIPEQNRFIGVGDRNEGNTIDWDLLKERTDKNKENKNKKIKVRKKDILLFTKRLQIMLASGMTLINALSVLAEGDNKRGLPILVNKLIESIQSGNTFSESLSLFPKHFDYLYISLVSIGETSGTIHLVLLDIIDAKEQEYKISKQIKTAMVYPAIMGVVLTGILLLGSIFFVPAFEEMFLDQGLELPFVTSITFAIAGLMPYILVGIFIFITSFLFIKRNVKPVDEYFNRIKHSMLLKIPVIKNINMLTYMHGFSFTISLMLKNGIRLKDALEMSKRTINNIHIQEEIESVSLLMTEGLTMSEALEKQKYFDDIITNVALTGEESGQMSFSLEQISIYYKNELEKAIETAMEFVEPASIILIALIILPVILAIYLPILDISSGANLDL